MLFGMNLADFRTARTGLRVDASVAGSVVRSVFEDGLRSELLASGLFQEVEVGTDADADRLVLGLATFDTAVDMLDVAAALETIWSRLAFGHWQAHAFLTAEGHVELQAATLDRPGGRFVTAHVVAHRAVSASGAEVPAPRDAAEALALPRRSR
jgi:hypothetical protein